MNTLKNLAEYLATHLITNDVGISRCISAKSLQLWIEDGITNFQEKQKEDETKNMPQPICDITKCDWNTNTRSCNNACKVEKTIESKENA